MQERGQVRGEGLVPQPLLPTGAEVLAGGVAAVPPGQPSSEGTGCDLCPWSLGLKPFGCLLSWVLEAASGTGR